MGLDSIAGEEIMRQFFTKISAGFNRNCDEIVKEISTQIPRVSYSNASRIDLSQRIVCLPLT